MPKEKTFLLSLPEELHKELKTYSVKSGKSMNEMIIKSIDDYLWKNTEM